MKNRKNHCEPFQAEYKCTIFKTGDNWRRKLNTITRSATNNRQKQYEQTTSHGKFYKKKVKLAELEKIH